jgi:hypothetical protein
MSRDKSAHVVYLTEYKGHTFNGTADSIIGAILIICLLVGLIGNISAFLYFFRGKKESLPNMLYAIVSAVDTCTCVLTVPVICSLMSDRQPTRFFNDYTICGLWYIPFYFALRFSQFMVLIISVTRTIAILAPFLHRYVNRTAILVACGIYAGYVLIVEAVHLGSGVTKFLFLSMIASPSTSNSVFPPDWQYTALVVQNLANLILLSIVVFVSFVLSTRATAKVSTTGNKDFQRVTITITIFTAVFLICNLPMFLSELLTNIFLFFDSSLLKNANKNPFFFWYFILISYRVLITINAALNPVVYFWRMQKFRKWIVDSITSIWLRRSWLSENFEPSDRVCSDRVCSGCVVVNPGIEMVQLSD